MWAAAKLKLPQMTRAPARADELDTDALAWCWPPSWHILAGGRGTAGAALAAHSSLCGRAEAGTPAPASATLPWAGL